jgi:hypothetical protein
VDGWLHAHIPFLKHFRQKQLIFINVISPFNLIFALQTILWNLLEIYWLNEGTKFGAVNHHKDSQPTMPELEVTNGKLSALLFSNRKVNEIKIEFFSHSYKS